MEINALFIIKLFCENYNKKQGCIVLDSIDKNICNVRIKYMENFDI